MTDINTLGTNTLRRLVTELREENARLEADKRALRRAIEQLGGTWASDLLAADDKAARESALDRMAEDARRMGLGYDDKAQS